MALIDTQTLIKHIEQRAEKYAVLKENEPNTFILIFKDAVNIALREAANAILATEAESSKNLNPTNWSNAPEWANWKATDKDGTVYWYQCEPYPYAKNAIWFSNGGKYALASSPNYDWDSSLEHRPT